MRALSPWDIYSRDPTMIETEKDRLLEQFRPKDYKKIEYFILQQRIVLLYRQAIEELSGESSKFTKEVYEVIDTFGTRYSFNYIDCQEQKICKFLTTKSSVIIMIPAKYKQYYENYISKCNFRLHVNRQLWEDIKYFLPEIVKTFQTSEGNFIIILKRPNNEVYPIKKVLDYFDGALDAKIVASILTRLYKVAIYLDLRGISHNGITVENLFFSPGRFVNPGESISPIDVRVVGLYGGWFFSTFNNSIISGFPNERIIGLPKSIKDILPDSIKDYHYGNYKIDLLAIKQVGRQLLGENIGNAPSAMSEWLNNNSIEKNVFEEFSAWENVIIDSFQQKIFVEMNDSIDE